MSERFQEIMECRICQSKRLTEILDLGKQALTGVFPSAVDTVLSTPLRVCKCDHCHLVQLQHSVDLNLMYGETYGYQSSLNASMVRHLREVATRVQSAIQLVEGDLVVDIGSNDATFLKSFDSSKFELVGIDPTAIKFLSEYGQQEDGGQIHVIPEFFSIDAFHARFPARKARLITSIACFYDLERPIQFARETAGILADDGIWFMEMAYLPTVLSNLCFDGFVHEHLEYYSLRDIKYIMDQAGLKIVDVGLSDTNGGSFMVTVAHERNPDFEEYWRLASMINAESHLLRLDTYLIFEREVQLFRRRFTNLLQDLKDQGKKVFGLGASTKFNVILQYCGIDEQLLPGIGEVNAYKFGRVTPGSRIPIVAENDILAENPDYLVVGPYHFRQSFIRRMTPFLEDGGRLIFPLPTLEVYGINKEGNSGDSVVSAVKLAVGS